MKQPLKYDCFLERLRDKLDLTKAELARCLGWSLQRYHAAVPTKSNGASYPTKALASAESIAQKVDLPVKTVATLIKDLM
jgi:hypothetical protein